MERNPGFYNTYLEHFDVTSTTSLYQPAASPPPPLQIILHFSCKPIFSLLVLNQDSDEPELVSSDSHPMIENTVLLNLHQLLDDDKARQVIGNKLSNVYLMGGTMRRRWVDSALKTARKIVGSMPAEYNFAVVRFPVTFNIDHFISDDRLMSVEEENNRNNYMVKKTLTEYSNDCETCAVCLEDFAGGGGCGCGCEAVSMPCEHYFHEDCIGKFLRTSHHCPVCRFKVPTNELGFEIQ